MSQTSLGAGGLTARLSSPAGMVGAFPSAEKPLASGDAGLLAPGFAPGATGTPGAGRAPGTPPGTDGVGGTNTRGWAAGVGAWFGV